MWNIKIYYIKYIIYCILYCILYTVYSCQTRVWQLPNPSLAAAKLSLAAAKLSLAAAKPEFGSCQTCIIHIISYILYSDPQNQKNKETTILYIYIYRERERYTSWYIIYGVRFGPPAIWLIIGT